MFIWTIQDIIGFFILSCIALLFIIVGIWEGFKKLNNRFKRR